MTGLPLLLLLQASLAFLICAPPTVLAVQGPSGLVPVLTATKVNKSNSKASIESLKERVLGIPPVELDLQLDVDLSFSDDETTKTKARSQPKTNAFVAKPRLPTPPRKKKAAPKKIEKSVPTKQKKREIQSKNVLSSHLGDMKRQLATVSNRISQHKYAKIVWATLLFIWTPLLLIWLTNQIMGKEFLIGILVGILPEQVPASYIEMAIEDALWVGIFGVCFGVTAGAFVIEAATLAFDVLFGSKTTTTKRS